MLFERKEEPILQLEEIQKGVKIKEDKESIIFKLGDRILKLQEKHTVKDEIRYFIASHSPISNGVLEWIYSDGEFQGWTEEYSNLERIIYKQRQNEVWQKICEHNIFLAKLGYTDIDTATINFFSNLTLFDKGGTFHIDDLIPLWIEDITTGYYFIMFGNSYDIPIDLIPIHHALNSKDSYKIQKVYEDMITSKSQKFSLKRFFKRLMFVSFELNKLG